MSKKYIWLDTDCGVDDALAILFSLKQEEIEVVGMSSVAGNVTHENTFKNTRNVVHLAKRDDVKVYPGAIAPLVKPLHTAGEVHGNDGLGGVVIEESPNDKETKKAWDAMYEASLQYENLHIVAVGPLTNVAMALEVHKDLVDHVEEILFMGGSMKYGNVTPAAEFNIFADPHAAKVVMESSVKKVMCGLDVTLKNVLVKEDLDRLQHLNPACSLIQDSSTVVMDLYERLVGKRQVVMHDTTPLMYLVHPELFKGEMCGVRVETRGTLTVGRTVCDLYTDHKFDVRNVFAIYDVDALKFKEYVFDTLLHYYD